jgi:hypothetical protein
MILDYSTTGELMINMIPSFKMVLESIPEEMKGHAGSKVFVSSERCESNIFGTRQVRAISLIFNFLLY